MKIYMWANRTTEREIDREKGWDIKMEKKPQIIYCIVYKIEHKSKSERK